MRRTNYVASQVVSLFTSLVLVLTLAGISLFTSPLVFAASAPGGPTNVGLSVGNNEFTVSWDAPASDGGSPITGYSAQAYESDGVTPVANGSCTTTTLTCDITNLTGNREYEVDVTATNNEGTGTASSQVSGTPTAPLAARLLAIPYNDTTDGGLSVTVSNLSNLVAISNDGSTVYLLNSSGNIVTVPMSEVTGSPGSAIAATGTLHTVSGWGSGGVPSFNFPNGRSMAYSHGCLFITDDTSATTNPIGLYCIDVSNWTVSQVTVPAGDPLPNGAGWEYGALIDFSDGQIGKISADTLLNSGPDYTSYMRMYNVTGTGNGVSLTWAQDYTTSDVPYNGGSWNSDAHGIATDGRYLYNIQYEPDHPDYDFKVWPLSADTDPYPIYQGSYTVPFGNMTYLSHNHTTDQYMMGNYEGDQFYITESADPGPGPGNPLTPTFGAVSSTVGGYTVQITNYDSSFDWTGSSTAGSVNISSSGLVTVSGLSSDQSATLTVNNSKTNYPDGSANTSGQALDVNNDGTDDSTQPYIANLINSVTGKASAVQVNGSCTLSNTSNEQVSSIGSDPGYSYPLGLINFTAACGTPGFKTTVTEYYYDPPSDSFILRKYVDGKFTTVTSATFSNETIDGRPVLAVSYPMTDGGPLDEDGVANGVIVDPAGPAVTDTSTSGGTLADTGINLALVTLCSTLLVACAVRVYYQPNRGNNNYHA